MIVNRRAFFLAALVVGAAASLTLSRGLAATASATKARNIVLVHGLFADGSSWSEVIARLQAAWRSNPSLYAVSTEDRMINPDLERFMAKRMGAKTIEVKASHVSLISHPDLITA